MIQSAENFLIFKIKVYWRKCLLTFAIFTCAFFLVLTAFLMLEGTGQSAKAMQEQYHATITVVDYNVRSPDRYDSNLISPGTVDAFRAHPLAEHVTTFAYSAARSVPGLRPSAVEKQLEEYLATSFQVHATDNVEGAPDFAMKNYCLAEGELFMPGQTGGMLVSGTVAEKNGLHVGDTLTLSAYYTERGGQDAGGTVTGIYGIKSSGSYTEDPYYNSENLLYVTPDVGTKLNGNNINYYIATCTVETRKGPWNSYRICRQPGCLRVTACNFPSTTATTAFLSTARAGNWPPAVSTKFSRNIRISLPRRPCVTHMLSPRHKLFQHF